MRKTYGVLEVDHAIDLLNVTSQNKADVQSLVFRSATDGSDPIPAVARVLGTSDPVLLAPLLEYSMAEVFVVSGEPTAPTVRPFAGLYPAYRQWKETKGVGAPDLNLPGPAEEYAAYLIAKNVADIVAPGSGETVGWIVSKDPDLRRLVVQGTVDVTHEGGKLILKGAERANELQLVRVGNSNTYALVDRKTSGVLGSLDAEASIKEGLERASKAYAATQAAITDIGAKAQAQWQQLKPKIELELGSRLEDLKRGAATAGADLGTSVSSGAATAAANTKNAAATADAKAATVAAETKKAAATAGAGLGTSVSSGAATAAANTRKAAATADAKAATAVADTKKAAATARAGLGTSVSSGAATAAANTRNAAATADARARDAAATAAANTRRSVATAGSGAKDAAATAQKGLECLLKKC